MNFDHLTPEQREAFERDILNLNKADKDNPIYGVAEPVIRYPEAKEQILRNDLAKAAQLRDEYKMQLDAANKELLRLRHLNKENVELIERISKDEYRNAIIDELDSIGIYSDELANDPKRAIQLICGWHCEVGEHFAKEESLEGRLKWQWYRFYSWFWNTYLGFRYRKGYKRPPF